MMENINKMAEMFRDNLDKTVNDTIELAKENDLNYKTSYVDEDEQVMGLLFESNNENNKNKIDIKIKLVSSHEQWEYIERCIKGVNYEPS